MKHDGLVLGSYLAVSQALCIYISYHPHFNFFVDFTSTRLRLKQIWKC